MDLDSRAQYKLVSVGYSDVNFEEYRRILEALCPLGERYDHETPEMWSPVSVVHLGKYLKRIQESFLKMDLLQCMESYMKVIVKFTVIHQIIYIVAYATPWYLYLESIQDVLIAIKITT